MDRLHPFMVRHGEPRHVTEPDVSVPPALHLTDQAGARWTLGFRCAGVEGGEFAYDVLRDGLPTGVVANRIERKAGRIRAFTADGWRWLEVVAQGDTFVYGIGAKFEGAPVARAISVKVYRESRPDQPLVAFVFNAGIGGTWESQQGGAIACPPGEWLFAVVDPAESVKVSAQVGERTLREIPVQPVSKELHHA